MRELATYASYLMLGVGGLCSVVLILVGLTSLNSYSGGIGWMGVGLGVGVLLSSAATACILALLVSIDERLEAAGLKTRAEIGTPEEAAAACRVDSLLNPGTPQNQGKT